MRRILISLVCGATLALAGCSSLRDFSLVYTPDIQQGNKITPEMVAQLHPGMSKRQVRFLMGTPLLVDAFHQERWDYPYTMKRRNQPMQLKLYSLFFEGDQLVHFQGDIKPAKDLEKLKDKKEIVVSVPDYEGEDGLFERAMKGLGLGTGIE